MSYPADCFAGYIDGAWFDAQSIANFRRDGTALTTYGGAFDEWRDKSGNNRHATQPLGYTYDGTTHDDAQGKYADVFSSYQNVGGGGGSGAIYLAFVYQGGGYEHTLYTDVNSGNANSGFKLEYDGDYSSGRGAYLFSLGINTARVQVAVTVHAAGTYANDPGTKLVEAWWSPSRGLNLRVNRGTPATASQSWMQVGSSTYKLFVGTVADVYGVVYTRNACPDTAGRDATAAALAALASVTLGGSPADLYPAQAFAGGVDGVWYDAQSLSSFKRGGVALSAWGDFFDEWADKSGNAHHLQQWEYTMDGIAYDYSGVAGKNYRCGWLWQGMTTDAGAGASTGFYLAIAYEGINHYYGTLFSDHSGSDDGFRLEYQGAGTTGSNGPVFIFSAGQGSSRTRVWLNADVAHYSNDKGKKLIECWWSPSLGLNIRKNKGPVSTVACSTVDPGTSGFMLPLYHFVGNVIAYLHTKNSVPDPVGRDAIADRFAGYAAISVPGTSSALTGRVHGREMTVNDYFVIHASVPRQGLMAASEVSPDTVIVWQTDRSERKGDMAASEAHTDRLVCGGPGVLQPPSAALLAWRAWLASPDRIGSVLVEVEVNEGVWRYLSSTGYTTGFADSPPSTHYLGVVNGGGVISETLSLTGQAGMSFGDIEIANTDGALDTWLADVWPGRSVRIYVGDHRWARHQFQMIFDGVVASLTSRSRTVLNLIVRDKLQRLNTAMTDAQLPQAGGGSVTNADRLVPLSFGEVSNISPVLANDALLLYQVHNGPIEDVIEVRDNGVPVNHVVDVANGQFRLLAQPAGAVTASVQGDKPNALGYANTCARLVRRIVTGFGVDSFLQISDLDEVSLAVFDAANPQALGVYLSDRANVLAVCQALAASVGAQLVMPAVGKLRLVKIALPGTPVPRRVVAASMIARTLHIVERTDVQPAVRLGYCKSWSVQPGLETGIPAEHKDLFAQEWFVARAVDAAVAATYRQTAEPEQIDTYLLSKADAEAEAQRRLALWKEPRTVFRYTGTADLLTEELGGYQTLVHPRFGLQDGKTGQIIRVERDWLAGRVVIEVLI